jgi:hypothetical protein
MAKIYYETSIEGIELDQFTSLAKAVAEAKAVAAYNDVKTFDITAVDEIGDVIFGHKAYSAQYEFDGKKWVKTEF